MADKRTRIHPVYAVVGHDRLLCGEALARILANIGDDMDETGPVRLDGSAVGPADVLDEVRTMSLLGARRVVIVEDADDLMSDAKHRKTIERYCEAPAETGSLIFLFGSLPSNRRIYKIIAKTGEICTCETPKGASASAWVRDRARRVYGKGIAAQAVAMLRDRLGDESGMLDAELSKLTDYIGGRSEIAVADVTALTGRTREEKVFGVINAVADGNAESALEQWEQVLATDRAAPGRAIAGLAWAVRSLMQARRDWESGTDLAALTRRTFTDPATLRRRLEAVSVDWLEEQQRDLLAADVAIKTGAGTVGAAVEGFIVKHAVAVRTG